MNIVKKFINSKLLITFFLICFSFIALNSSVYAAAPLIELDQADALGYIVDPNVVLTGQITTDVLAPTSMQYQIDSGSGFACTWTGPAASTPLQLDPAFQKGDAKGAGAGAAVHAIAIQSDGKVLIGGNFQTYNGTSIARIARINIDGTIDKTFNPGSGANAYVYAIAIQSDGKILIGGDFTTYNGVSRSKIARLNSDGSLDTSFVPGTGANWYIKAVGLQSDGQILIAGDFTTYNGTSINRIARLNTDGTLDASFIPGTGANYVIDSIALQTDGKIIIVGEFTSYNGTSRGHIARVNTNGSLDATFNPGTGTSLSTVMTTKIQNDGQILISGMFTTYNGTARNRIARVNTDGTLDTSFDPGTGANQNIEAMTLQSDGKILIAGDFTSYNGTARNYIARLNTNGTIDTSLDPGVGPNTFIYAVAAHSDGGIFIGGAFSTFNGLVINYITRINGDGTLDIPFNTGTGSNNFIDAIALQSDGKILIGGSFTAYNGVTANRLARINADGTLDATFNTGTGAGGTVSKIVIQSDGKVLIGGLFTTYNGIAANRIARLNTDGSLDATFVTTVGANNTVSSIAIQGDGKIIIVGNFTSYNGTTINRIARLNTDGSLDGTYVVGTGVNVAVSALALQSDGKALIGGNFTLYNGVSKARIARINTDGTLDTTFNLGTGPASTVSSIAIQTDGKIFIGGNFTTYNAVAAVRIARLNTDGSLDTAFVSTIGAANNVTSIATQADGKVYIGGIFLAYDGTSINRFARINADGTLDATFNPGTGANGSVSNILMQPDGNMLVAGRFSDFMGQTAYVARLTGLSAAQIRPFSCDVDLTGVADGDHTISINALDNLSVVMATKNVTFSIDKSAPTTTVSGYNNIWYSTDVTVNFTCLDLFSGCAFTYFTTDGSDPTTFSSEGTSTTISAEGSYTIKYFSVDTLGNTEIVQTAASPVQIDKSAPTIPTISNISYDVNNIPTLSWSSSADILSGLGNPTYTFEWSTDSGFATFDTVDTNSTFYTFPAPLANGTWYFRVKAKDAVNNTSDYSVSYSAVVNITPTPTPTATPTSTPTTTPGVSGTVTPTSITTQTVTPTVAVTVGPTQTPIEVLNIQYYVEYGQTGDTVKIVWSTDLPAKGYIKYGEIVDGKIVFTGFTLIEDAFILGQRITEIGNLIPGKEYGFEIVANTEAGTEKKSDGSFSTTQGASGDFIEFLGYTRSDNDQITIKFSTVRIATCNTKYGNNESNLNFTTSTNKLSGFIYESSFRKPEFLDIYFRIVCEEANGQTHEYKSMLKISDSEQTVNTEDTLNPILEYFKSRLASIIPAISLIFPILSFSLPNLINGLYLLRYGLLFVEPKKKKQFGLVFDQLTKNPVAFAVIRVFDNVAKQIAISVSDRNGKYRLDLNLGNYKYEAAHSEYNIKNLNISAKSEADLIVDFPLIQKSAEDGGFSINYQIVFSKLLSFLTAVFFVHSILCLLINPIAWNQVVVILYLLIFFIRYLVSRIAKGGMAKDADGKVLGGVQIQLMDKDKKLVDKSISTEQGRIQFNVEDGEYLINVWKEGYKLKDTEGLMKAEISHGRLKEDVLMVRDNGAHFLS